MISYWSFLFQLFAHEISMLKHVEYDDEWTEFVHAGWSRASILCIGLQIQESYSDIQEVSGTVFLLRISGT